MKIRIITMLFTLVGFTGILFAGGISVDAGLTPAQDRFILRTQYRFMSMSNPMMISRTHMTPLVLAYGVTPGFSVMARGMYVHRTFSDRNEIRNGLNDPFLLTKFRLYRKNTRSYVLGVAPHIASNIPVGSEEISNRVWSPEAGLNISFRPRFLAVDLSTSYTFTDISGKSEGVSGDVFSLNTAFSAFIPVKGLSSTVVSPVLELSYIHKARNRESNVEANDILFLSPGVSLLHSSLVVEALLQLPVYQSESPDIMDQQARLITGIRYMF